jgi:hypothetical protein
MWQKIFLFILASLSISGWGLDKKPWLGDVYEAEWLVDFTYSRYHKVQDAIKQLTHTSNDKLYATALSFTASESLDLQMEVELADTPRMPFGWRSVAFQTRYRWLNDIAGDSFSIVSGFDVRAASSHSLRDVSSPYHANANFEFTSAIGKEWSKGASWSGRTFGFMGVGLGNRGAPWLRFLGVWESNLFDAHRFLLGLEGYFGFGGKKRVDIDHFYGWAPFQHESLDLSLGYAYHMPIWGTLGVRYAYRVFAQSFPEHVQFITLFYRLPFSIF